MAVTVYLLCIFSLKFPYVFSTKSIMSNFRQFGIRSTLKNFQLASNGFDVRGVIHADENGKLDGPLLDNEISFWFGFGFSKWLSENSVKNFSETLTVGVGYDPRKSGEVLSSWFSGGVECAGGIAYQVGLCTTPSMFLSCTENFAANFSGPWPFTGAVSITASHLPSQWNGMKFFDEKNPNNIGSEGISRLIEIVQSEEFNHIIPYSSTKNNSPLYSVLPMYSEILKKEVRNRIPNRLFPLKGLRIVVNPGNGAGGFLATTLAELGADTSKSINLEPDGTFPNHVANPEDKAAIAATATCVLLHKAHLGICLDTDADRVGLVDANGKILNRNCLIALVSKIALRDNAGGVIVTDSATSLGLTRYLENVLGGRHIRFKKGYRDVIDLGRSTSGCVAAVECSGHGAWRDNGWIDDGCYTAIRLVTELALLKRDKYDTFDQFDDSIDLDGLDGSKLSLSDLILDLQEPAESVELRLRVTGGPNEMKATMKIALDLFRSLVDDLAGWSVEPVNHDGIRATFQVPVNDSGSGSGRESTSTHEGWCMLRASLHEPILSLQIESERLHGAAAVAKQLLFGSVDSKSKFADLSDIINLTPLIELANRQC